MAGLLFRAQSGEVSLTATTAKTVLSLIAAANHRVKVRGFSVSFKGTSNTDTPVKVRIARLTSDGTGTANTLVKENDADDETLQSSSKLNYTVEPTYTANTNLEHFECHPQTGKDVFYPFGQELIVKGGGMIGVECTASQNQTVSVTLHCDE
jgi:hypothetical protein